MTVHRLLVDVDGVLARFNKPYIQRLLQFEGPPPKRPAGLHDMMDVWNREDWITVWDYPQEILGYTQSQVARVWDTIRQWPEFWATLEPYETAVADLLALRSVESRGLGEVYFVTTRMPAAARYITARWLHDLGYPGASVILSDGQRDKGTIAKALGITAGVDDKPENVVDIYEAGVQAFVFDRPWNRDFAARRRVSSVREMLEQIGIPQFKLDAGRLAA